MENDQLQANLPRADFGLLCLAWSYRLSIYLALTLLDDAAILAMMFC